MRSPHRKIDGIYHTVKKNQTLWSICKTYNVGVREVAELNNIKNTSSIRAGDRIFIPGAERVLYVAPTVKKRPSERSSAPKKTYSKPSLTFTWPVRGAIIKSFGIIKGMKHDGINIQVKKGAGIVAAQTGRVVFSDYLEGYGPTIILQHRNSYATVYANISRSLVPAGTTVQQGSTIAYAASTAMEGGKPYLHFQIRRYNQPRNPLFYLP